MKPWCTFGAVGVVLVFSRGASAEATIEHDRARCLPQDQFIQLLAEIRPPEEVRTAKVYFRSSLYPDYYYVEMSGQGAAFQAILPMPTEETARIVYYLETVDLAFNTTRSREIEVNVTRDSRCSPGPGAMLFNGTDPGLVIGATRLGLSALPPGFQAAGVAGFISAAGAAAGAGGGVGIGVAVGAAAGAAAGVGVVVANSGDDPSSTSVTTTSPASATTTISGTSSATTTTTAAPGSTTSSSPTPTTTSSVSSTTSIAPTPLNACFEWTALGNCRVHFASCSTPRSDIVSYVWRMLGPPPNIDIGSTESFDFDFSPYDPRCTGTMTFNRPIRLTVTDGAGNMDEEQKNVDVIPGAIVFHGAKLRMTVRMIAPGEPNARGVVAVNGRGPRILSGTGPLEIVAEGRANDYEILAYSQEPQPSGAFFEFELATEDGLAPSSIQVLQGSVAERGTRRIVVRSGGSSGETVTLRVRLSGSP